MNLTRFESYSAEDFVMDKIFCKIVDKGSLSIQHLKGKFPLKQNEIDMAIEMLIKLQNLEFQQSPEKKLEQWNMIRRKQKRSLMLQFFKIAASIILIAGGGSFAFYHFKQHDSIEKFVSQHEIDYSVGKLILANGKQIDIEQKQSVISYTADGTGVLVNDTAKIKQSVEEDSFNQIIVPFGKRSSLMLSDGTKVWMNSGSRLVYSPLFKGKSREVFLEGEAYFEVAKDEKKPFYVRTNAFKLKVYGTKFDVQAYKQDNEYNTVLIEGKVSLILDQGGILAKEQFLFPAQIAMLSADKKDFLITEAANIDHYTAWKEGYLIFKNEPFHSILKRVSHYYNIDIEIINEIQIKRLSGKLDLKDDPEKVLDGLALISKSRYVKNVNKFNFYIDSPL